MADVLVTCVTKPNRNSPHEHITHLGGPGGGGWTKTTQEVISLIKRQIDTFYTWDGQKRANIKVNSRNGREFVQTYADGDWKNNLLSLDACPI